MHTQTTKLCSIEGCERPAKTRGWCATHYLRWFHHGDPLHGGAIKSIAERNAVNGLATRLMGGQVTHGQSGSPTHRGWKAMLTRCYNPKAINYAYYGGRGITVCERWRASFADFLADMGERPDGKTLDRIDSDGHYEPGNCRWATPLEQTANRRISHS